MVDLNALEAGQIDVGVALFDNGARGRAADMGGPAQAARTQKRGAAFGVGKKGFVRLSVVDQQPPFDGVSPRQGLQAVDKVETVDTGEGDKGRRRHIGL